MARILSVTRQYPIEGNGGSKFDSLNVRIT